jgi:arginyl-tRNA synthetase
VKAEALASIVLEIKKQDTNFGKTNFGKKEKVLVEFVSANPTGPLTIAHGRQACVGDALVRMLNTAGFEAQSEYYLNDRGRQMNLLGESVKVRYFELLGKSLPFPEDGYQGDYIRDIAKQVMDENKEALDRQKESELQLFFMQQAMEQMMASIREDLQSIGVTFHTYTSERGLFENKKVDQALEAMKKKGVLFEEDGALWFRSTQFGDDKDRVLKKSSGDWTYLTPDIAYHKNKFDRGFSMLVNLWGPDHHGYIARMKAAVQALGYNAEKLNVILVQLTTLYRNGEPFRMSTRKGDFITLKQLVDEVGADATRLFFLMRKTDSHLDFDLELAKQKSQDNPVYYLQYAHARICSMLRFAGREVPKSWDGGLLKADEEAKLFQLLAHYPQMIQQACVHLEPYSVVDYLRELAAAFHRFYALHRVINPDEALTDARLALVDSIRIVLRNGLEMLGISHPESM